MLPTLVFTRYIMVLASHVLQIPPSYSACERNWSKSRDIHARGRSKIMRDESIKKIPTERWKYSEDGLNSDKPSNYRSPWKC